MTRSGQSVLRVFLYCGIVCAAIAGLLTRPTLSAQPAAQAIKFAHAPHIANDGRIAFSYHEDIWIADADGSNARRLTAHLATDTTPRFSPDGKWVAFTSNRAGNNDVFVIPAAGGEARQLTYYSGDDQVLYWAPDGKHILMSSSRGPGAFGSPLFLLPIDGSPEEPIKMASARLGMLKQDGSLLAFNRALPSTGVWRKAFKGNSAPGLAVEDMTTHADHRNHQYRDEGLSAARQRRVPHVGRRWSASTSPPNATAPTTSGGSRPRAEPRSR